jgi:hypothetical protein
MCGVLFGEGYIAGDKYQILLSYKDSNRRIKIRLLDNRVFQAYEILAVDSLTVQVNVINYKWSQFRSTTDIHSLNYNKKPPMRKVSIPLQDITDLTPVKEPSIIKEILIYSLVTVMFMRMLQI